MSFKLPHFLARARLRLSALTWRQANSSRSSCHVSFSCEKSMAEPKSLVSINGTEAAMVTDRTVNGNCELKGMLHGNPKCPPSPENESSSPPLKKQRHPETLKQETLKQETLKQETLKQETLKQETLKQETLKQETLKQETLKQETLKQETLKQETLKQETLKQETLKQETLKQETLKQETLKQETLKQETLKQETLNNETPANPNSMDSYKTFDSAEPLENSLPSFPSPPLLNPLLSKSDRHVAAAWEYFKKLGSPKFHVAPMVDQSELPFRMLCRKYGATSAYTPMLHSRLYAEDPKYRREFTTCQEDRPLFVQFCANSPQTLLAAAKLVVPFADYVDINFGCPQRIAKRGNYGAFLMDDLPLVCSLVSELSKKLPVPVSCKIRVFPTLEETLAYARMIEKAGCSLLAVHGRTRDQKNQKAIRADWDIIRAVKQSLRIPVIANGNVRWLEDAEECMRVTGVDGVMSAESLLENPALFGGYRLPGNEGEEEGKNGITEKDERQKLSCSDELVESGERTDLSQNGARNRMENGKTNGEINGETNGELNGEIRTKKPDQISLILEYLDLAEKYPVPPRMVRAHVHKLLGCWFRVHKDIRERLNKAVKITPQWLKELVKEMEERNLADPSLRPLPEAPEKRGGGQVLVPPPANSIQNELVSQGESQETVSMSVMSPKEVIRS